MNIKEILKNALIGKTLTGCEFGMNEPGCQSVNVPQRITDVRLGVLERDSCVWLMLENGERAHIYFNEDIYLTEG